MDRNEYKSIEERVNEFALPVLKGLTRGFIGTVKAPFVIPSLLRKYANNQTWLQRFEDSQITSKSVELGAMMGVSLGMALEYYLGDYITSKGMLTEAISTLVASNICSMTFEVFRTTKTVEEYDIRKNPIDWQI